MNSDSVEEKTYPELLLAKYFKAYNPYDGEAEQTLAALDRHYASKFLELVESERHDMSLAAYERLKAKIKELWDV